VREIARPLLLVAITLPIIVPLLRPGWIQSHEGFSYPIRLVEVRRAWEDGFLSARWFPDLNCGQGYPFLSFYAPLLFLIAGVIHVAGVDVATALKLVCAGGVVAGAVGMDRLVREALRNDDAIDTPASSAAGLVAAALFVHAPYFVRDIFIRGDLAESLATGLLPWSVWGMLRLRRVSHPRSIAQSSILGALPILAHNVIGLFNGVFLALAAAVITLTSREKRRVLAACVAAGFGTLALSAFFWAPALHEKQFVQIDVMTRGHFDATEHFVTLQQLLGRGAPVGNDQKLPMSFEIGWVGIAGVALAGVFARALWRTSRAALLVGGILFFGGTVRTMEMSRPVYEAVELLRFVQFPWRFLAIVALGSALLGGLGFAHAAALLGPRLRSIFAGAFVAAAIAFVFPILGPKPNHPLPSWALDPAKYRERRETTTVGEYLPIDVESIEPPRGYADGVKLEGGGRVVRAERKTGRYDVEIAPGATAIALQDVYFPGWIARVDGTPVAIEVERPTGRMRIPLPPNARTIEVRLAPTPLRFAAGIVSAMAALAALALLVLPHSPRSGARVHLPDSARTASRTATAPSTKSGASVE
jgi:hypothetical protein